MNWFKYELSKGSSAHNFMKGTGIKMNQEFEKNFQNLLSPCKSQITLLSKFGPMMDRPYSGLIGPASCLPLFRQVENKQEYLRLKLYLLDEKVLLYCMRDVGTKS